MPKNKKQEDKKINNAYEEISRLGRLADKSTVAYLDSLSDLRFIEAKLEQAKQTLYHTQTAFIHDRRNYLEERIRQDERRLSKKR